MNDKGFTLLEILVVIAIIGVLSTFGVVAYRSSFDDAENAKALADIDAIHSAIGALMTDTGEWPGHQTPEAINSGASNEIWDLSTAASGIITTDGNFNDWNGPYMPSIPLDPWGNPYFLDTDYSISGSDVPVIGSFGPNGVGPNVYDGDDVIKVIY